MQASYREHDYTFGQRMLALRTAIGLSQARLADLLKISRHAVGGWEAGESYPTAEHLKQIIALGHQQQAFAATHEAEEIRALWRAAHQKVLLDEPWLQGLLSQQTSPQVDGAVERTRRAERASAPQASGEPRVDWGEAPFVPLLHGRARELAKLGYWVREQRCRVVSVLGMGGIGKTSLVARLAQDLAPEFAVVYWRSLRNAPPVEEWLAGAIAALSAGQAVPPEGLAAQLRLLLGLLRAQRSLLILDNLETVLSPGSLELRYRAGYEGYGAILQQLAESAHPGCLLLTSREQPLRADDSAVRALRLDGLAVAEARALLGHRVLLGDDAAWRALVKRYAGNPLALQVVGETISVMFGGAIAAFLGQETAVFGGIRQLLDEQLARLSPLEHALLYWLAIEREPVRFAALLADLGPEVARSAVLEALEALDRRSLLERASGGAFTLQPVVLEFISERLVTALAREILVGQPVLLRRHAVMLATAKDYVRRSQERLLGQPIVQNLVAASGAGGGERRMLELLEGWRQREPAEQGYGPGNVVNLLRLLRGDLRGLDLSHLAIRQAYLQEVAAQDASLAGAELHQAVLVEAFHYPMSVALSADGAYLAAGTTAGELCLWRVADRTPLLSVHGHTGLVWGVALSADGQLVASGSYDGTVKLWDAASGRLLATLQGHTGGVWSVALSADGQLVASGGYDGTVRLWDAVSGRLLVTLEGHAGAVRGVALSGDGQLLASSSYDGTVRLWDAARGRLLATLQGHTGGVYGVALSADGQLVASGGYDRTVRLWDAASGRLLSVQGYTGGVLGMTLSADGQLVASGSYDGTVRLWDAVSGRLLATLQGHTGAILGMALSGDGQLLASSSFDGTVRLWDAASGRLLATLQGRTSGVLGMTLSVDGQLVASGSEDRMVRLWDATSGRLLATLEGHTGGVVGMALSGDGQLVASGSEDGTVKLWDATSGRLLATLQGHTGGVRGVALSGDGQLVASGSFDGTVRLWEASSGRLLATLEGHTGLVYNVALSEDGRLVASGGEDGTVKLWETASGRLLATLQGHTGLVCGVALSGDGQFVASGGFDGTVRLWDAASGRLLATLEGHTGAVWAVALSGDGQLVASGSFDGTVRLWEASSGTFLRTLRRDRPYERMDITDLTGITPAQRASLIALGAVERPRDRAPALASAPPGDADQLARGDQKLANSLPSQ
ncbi:MAG TPA: helix-turn-helix domain-containing protein [Chloroflexia bacterium]|nr:helix-turn-helix domain-containing protein [Chloroflexia bacterium]